MRIEALMSTQPIRLVVVDDQDTVRAALQIFCETYDDIELVGTAASVQDAIFLCENLKPDVVLMDIMLSERPDGIVAAHAIHQTMPNIHIIAISSFCSAELIEDVFEAGIGSYLYKSLSIDELADAIRTASIGKRVVSSVVAQTLNQAGKSLPPGASLV